MAKFVLKVQFIASLSVMPHTYSKASNRPFYITQITITLPVFIRANLQSVKLSQFRSGPMDFVT